MASNSFGKIFKLSSFGESHGVALGGVIDGCPAGFAIDMDEIHREMARRKPGQSAIVTQRKEADEVEILSGIFEGITTGMPIGFVIRNTNQKSKDYSHIKDQFRPSHADYTYQQKYGTRDYRGGGRSSARETVSRVFAGAVAKQVLASKGISVDSYVSQVGDVKLDQNYQRLDLTKIDSNDVRCPDEATAALMDQKIRHIRKEGDTIGGIVTCVLKGLPVGIGSPVFDKFHADLAKAIMSINACKGFDYGSGFEGITMKGSEHNDAFYQEEGSVRTKTNYSGGVQGGITNGEDVYFRAAFKPVATIMKGQASIDKNGNEVTVEGKGRHDACVLPRAVPIVDAMAALVALDHLLLNQTSKLS
jgi:chorismate synthase